MNAALEYVKAYEGQAADLLLAISDQLNDPAGMNMAIIGDAILGRGFMPEGFEQKEGYRVYKYKDGGE